MAPLHVRFFCALMALTLVVILIAVQPVVYAANLPQPLLTEIDKLVRLEMQRHHIPGIAISIVDGDKATYSKGYGFSDPRLRIEMSDNTLFPLGSLSKLFTSSLYAIADHRHLVQLNEPIGLCTKEIARAEKHLRGINYRHLLSDSSGLPRELNTPYLSTNQYPSMSEFTQDLQTLLPIDLPGRRYHASNVGAALLGHCVAARLGGSYEAMLEKNLLIPLGMMNTYINIRGSNSPRQVAKGFRFDNRNNDHRHINFEPPNALSPARGIYSSAKDLIPFIQFQLGLDKHDVLPITIIQQMHEPLFKDGKELIGMGWHTDDNYGEKIFYASAMMRNFSSKVLLLPSANVGLVVMANVGHADVTGLTKQILEKLDVHQKIKMTSNDIAQKSDLVETMVGTYRFDDPEGGPVKIVISHVLGELQGTWIPEWMEEKDRYYFKLAYNEQRDGLRISEPSHHWINDGEYLELIRGSRGYINGINALGRLFHRVDEG